MAFIDITEMKSVMYNYQLAEITEGDNTITQMGIDSAIEEVRSYLTPNGQHQYRDGRLVYDVDAIFSAVGTARNPLILSITKTIAEWWIIQLCNADVVYEHVKERYDRAIKWLTQLNKGGVNLSDLPQKDIFSDTDPSAPSLYYGSRPKFNYE